MNDKDDIRRGNGGRLRRLLDRLYLRINFYVFCKLRRNVKYVHSTYAATSDLRRSASWEWIYIEIKFQL